jgi:hypothetical protein
MSATLPQLSTARVLSPAGPYGAGSVVSLAFVDPRVGRIFAHDPAPAAYDDARDGATIPDIMSVVLLAAAPPYARGDTLALSFVDPAIARIHCWRSNDAPDLAAERDPAAPAQPPATATASPAVDHGKPVVGLSLEWTASRVGRLVSLGEKLLGVDRLGWYRHALAVRLLLPDDIVIDDAVRDEAGRRLRALKMAATEALGTPLLAALMPNFTVDEEWLRSIETPAVARAAAALREVLVAHAGDGPATYALEDASSHMSYGTLRRADVERGAGGLDAFLASLVACDGATPGVSAALRAYKTASIDLFGQTAHASTAVRTTRLATPNPILDERLAALCAEIDGAFGSLAVA